MLAGGGDRSRRGTDTACLFPSPPVTSLNWENPKCVIECHILGDPFLCPTISPTWARAAHERWIQPRSPRSLFPAHMFLSLPVTVHLSLSSTHLPSPLLSLALPLFSSLFIQLASKRKPFHRGGVGGAGISLAFRISVVAIFEVETLLAIPRSSVSSNR